MKTFAILLGLCALLAVAYAQQEEVVATVGPNGDFATVKAAYDYLAGLSGVGSKRKVVEIAAGTYTEQINVRKADFTFRASSKPVTIQFNSPRNTKGGAQNSTFTIAVNSNNFRMYDINLVDIAPEVKDVATTALTIAAYNASFYNVNIYGFQDTLWFLNGRSYGYFKNCYVEGGVDFIYGSGVAFFDSCTIASNRDGAITAMQGGSATAIGHYVFQYCNIIPTLPSGPLAALADPDLSYTDPSQFPRTVFLGRPWDQFSRVVYLHSALGEHIAYEGWTSWQVPQGQLYGEYNNTGLGIFNDQRVSFATALNSVEAASYTFERFFGQNPAWLDTRYAPIRPDQCTASVSVIARPGNSWVANGQNFQVYEVKVHNIGDKKIKTLNVNINVGTATFNQKWNLNQVGENQYALPDWYQGFYVDGTSSDAGFIIGDSNALAPSVSIASLTC